MRTVQYAISSLHYYKKETLFLISLSSITLFFLTTAFSLKNVQSSFFTQLENRLDSSQTMSTVNSTKALEQLDHVYTQVIFFCLAVFTMILLLFFYYRFKKTKEEVLNWRILGLTFPKLFLLMTYQMLLPVFISAAGLFSLLLLFQQRYEQVLQAINYRCVTQLHIDQNLVQSSTATNLVIPFSHRNLFTIEFSNDLFINDNLLGFAQAVLCMGSCVLLIVIFHSAWQFMTMKVRKFK
ncbi:MAG: hypothetical protein ACK5NA_01990 [Enterococcus sp.]